MGSLAVLYRRIPLFRLRRALTCGLQTLSSGSVVNSFAAFPLPLRNAWIADLKTLQQLSRVRRTVIFLYKSGHDRCNNETAPSVQHAYTKLTRNQLTSQGALINIVQLAKEKFILHLFWAWRPVLPRTIDLFHWRPHEGTFPRCLWLKQQETCLNGRTNLKISSSREV